MGHKEDTSAKSTLSFEFLHSNASTKQVASDAAKELEGTHELLELIEDDVDNKGKEGEGAVACMEAFSGGVRMTDFAFESRRVASRES